MFNGRIVMLAFAGFISLLTPAFAEEAMKPSAVLSTFLERVSALGNAGELFSDNAVQKVPFAPEGVPKEIAGPGVVAAGFNNMGAMFSRFAYSDVTVLDTSDPEVAVAFAHGEGTLVNGAAYTQDYVFYARIQDGKIVEYREYMDPVRAAAAIAQLMGSQ